MRLFLALLALLLLFSEARAQTVGQPLSPLGYCQLTTLTSAVRLSTCSGSYGSGIPAAANAVILRVEAQAVRFTDDNVTTPTASTGQLLNVADPAFYWQGPIAQLQFIQAAASAKLNITFYRAPY